MKHFADTKEAVERDLEAMWEEYSRKVTEYADHIRRTVVEPFIQKRNYRFIAGNGAWTLVDNKTDETVHMWEGESEHDDDPELQEFVEILQVCTNGMPWGDLGSLM